jgi:UDP:flavonoid glycosyltransferase YjiC (YdhE family)
MNARRVQSLGAGLALHAQASVEELRAALREMLASQRFRDAARGLAVDGSGAQAADALEELAGA